MAIVYYIGLCSKRLKQNVQKSRFFLNFEFFLENTFLDFFSAKICLSPLRPNSRHTSVFDQIQAHIKSLCSLLLSMALWSGSDGTIIRTMIGNFVHLHSIESKPLFNLPIPIMLLANCSIKHNIHTHYASDIETNSDGIVMHHTFKLMVSFSSIPMIIIMVSFGCFRAMLISIRAKCFNFNGKFLFFFSQFFCCHLFALPVPVVDRRIRFFFSVSIARGTLN